MIRLIVVILISYLLFTCCECGFSSVESFPILRNVALFQLDCLHCCTKAAPTDCPLSNG